MSLRQRVESLQDYIKSGRIIEAMNEFYAPDVEMQENTNPPTSGLAANIEREKQFLAQVKVWKGYTVRTLAADETAGSAVVESVIEFVNHQDQPVRLEQVGVQRWKNGKIQHERFYYDASKK